MILSEIPVFYLLVDWCCTWNCLLIEFLLKRCEFHLHVRSLLKLMINLHLVANVWCHVREQSTWSFWFLVWALPHIEDTSFKLNVWLLCLRLCQLAWRWNCSLTKHLHEIVLLLGGSFLFWWFGGRWFCGFLINWRVILHVRMFEVVSGMWFMRACWIIDIWLC